MSDQLATPDENRRDPIHDEEALPGPSTEELQEPSTEKEPGEEPKAPEKQSEPQPSHQAEGVGVIGRPETELDETPER